MEHAVRVEGQPQNGNPRRPVVLWAFQKLDGTWCVRREGELHDTAYASREDAMKAARLKGERCGSYRFYIHLPDGRITMELMNLSARHLSPDDTCVSNSV